MDLATLVDLEWLLRDGVEPPKLPRAREHAVVAEVCAGRSIELAAARTRVDSDAGLRQAICARWIEVVRSVRDDLPGTRLARGLDSVAWILVVVGLVLGSGGAKSFLAYDGTVPVNVLHFATAFFGLQILLLVAMLCFVLRARRIGSGGAPGLLHRPIGFVVDRFLGERGRLAIDALRAMRSRRGLYADVERWTWFAIAQRFGVAFNVGALIVSFGLIAFSDLVFSWSTTLDLDAADVHAGVRAVSFPWWWLPSAIPPLETVAASQWVRMPGAFVGDRPFAVAIPLAAGWWKFLLAGLIAWGFLPRLCALLAGRSRARRALRAAPCDHSGYQALFDRLLPAHVAWEGPAPELVRGDVPSGALAAGPAPSAPGASTWVVVWGSLGRHQDRVVAQVVRRFGADVRSVIGAGGPDLAVDQAALDALRAARATRVMFVAAAGQQPTAEVLTFVSGVRAAIGTGRPLLVGLLEVGADGRCVDAEEVEQAAWRRSLGAMQDPHLWVEALEIKA